MGTAWWWRYILLLIRDINGRYEYQVPARFLLMQVGYSPPEFCTPPFSPCSPSALAGPWWSGSLKFRLANPFVKSQKISRAAAKVATTVMSGVYDEIM